MSCDCQIQMIVAPFALLLSFAVAATMLHTAAFDRKKTRLSRLGALVTGLTSSILFGLVIWSIFDCLS